MENAPIDLQHIRTPIALGFLVLLLAWESIHPFFNFFRDKTGERTRHAVRNLALGVFNILLVSAGFVLTWKVVATWAWNHNFGLLNWFGLGFWPRLIATVILMDLWTYAWHWINHRIPFFWRFHRMHHSDNRMDVTTASRFHAGEIVLSSTLRLAIIPFIGLHLWELAVYEVLLYAVVQFHHANVGLPASLDRFLSWIIPTPFMHKIHHSRLIQETNSNYSSLFSIWDRVFMTYRSRPDPESIEFGLTNWDHRQSITGMIRTPLEKLDGESHS